MAKFNIDIASSGSISAQALLASNQVLISGIAVGDFLGAGGGGSGITDHGLLTGLGDDDHTHYFLGDGARSMSGNLMPDFSQARRIGDRTINWKDIHATSGVFDSGIFPLFSTNGNLGNEQLLWKEIHAESGFFQKEFFFKGFSAHMANVYCGHNGATTLQVNNIPQVVPINTDVVIDFNYTRSSNEVTLASSGLYRITAQCTVKPFNNAGGARGIPLLRLQVGGADIAGAACYGYTREAGGGRASNLNIVWIDGYDAGDVIRMTIEDEANNEPNEEIVEDTARLIIERIR